MFDSHANGHERLSTGFAPAAPAVVLASASPRRARILEGAGFRVTPAPANLPEDRLAADSSTEAWALRLALEKAAATRRPAPDAVTVGADTMVEIDREVLGKPADEAEARAMLKRLRGRVHRVVTAVAVQGRGGVFAGWSETVVTIRDMPDAEIEAYATSGLPLDKAGGYGIQDRPFEPAADYEGCYLNVVGLPMCLLSDLLGRAGLDVEAECPGCRAPANTVAVHA